MNASEYVPGLEGVIAAETTLSDVDGEAGRLIIGGHLVESLVGSKGFEAVVSMLWSETEASTRAGLGAGRAWAERQLSSVERALALAEPMDALRAATAQLPESTTAHELTAAVGVFGAAWWARRRGVELPKVDPKASHAADLLRLIAGEAKLAEGLDAYLVAVVDHGLNASTFAARVVASTGSDLVSAITAGLGALKGPLHGGAPGPVLDMLDAIGAPPRAVDWLSNELAAGRRIMGMGHRVYRVRDPRAAVLEATVERLERSGVSTPRLMLARAVERAAREVLAKRYPDRSLQANVEFYTAVLLDVLGVPRQLFTSVFAASRVAGWCAHVVEQRAKGRLIRPSSRYVGPNPSR